jgi:histidine triad (HIT) family protein
MASNDCLFCRIRDGVIPAKPLYRDEHCFVLEDINPQVPTHLLVLPNRHIPTVNDLQAGDEALVGHLFTTAARLAAERGISGSGYRLVMNTLQDAGQTVFHLHLHLLGGRALGWPPG